jgi:8-oxo-dGTP diphosphatase
LFEPQKKLYLEEQASGVFTALAAGMDYVVLGPVAETATHPGAPPLGWKAVAALIEGYPLPVYLIGGLGPGDLGAARAVGA